jgi:hypothetical protein
MPIFVQLGSYAIPEQLIGPISLQQPIGAGMGVRVYIQPPSVVGGGLPSYLDFTGTEAEGIRTWARSLIGSTRGAGG